MKKILLYAVAVMFLLSACTGSGADTKISESKAKEIARTNAGLTNNDVNFLRVEKDRDDGRVVYEIEFYADGMEYDCEIDANTGAIISWEKEVR